MAITNFIPEIWSAKMLTEFRHTAVWAGLTNREYEGDLRSGNKLHITSPVPIAIKDYKAANRTTSADAISDTGIELDVDQEKNFDFYVDDIDRAQAAGNLNEYTKSAADGLVEDADKFLAALAVTNGTAVTPGAPATDAKTAWNVLRDLVKALNKAAVPKENRVFVANAEFEALLFEHDSKMTNADQSGTTEGLRNASLGKILRLDGYGSENLPETDAPQVVAMHRSSLAFVSQIQKTEAMRAENKFADRLRGLHVYGAKVVRPKAIAVYTAA
ncbi:hypothetical protein KTJ89_11300 [Brevibacterium sediminis]|uniref:P22 phage major capsid protein family protein n=1 Tax=Brevibacterium permense TaxID=234834 RepID=A0ABN2A8L7_9MICO|nr:MULTISPECIES: P22 phage major capsid protein family protein [Brevibacterium]MCS4593567.1 hypothetical protein [Brevibacterium sediminis]